MGIKTAIAALLGVAAFLIYLSPKPEKGVAETKIIYAEPLFMRAVSNISHTLLSDVLWLVSAESGELSTQKVRVEENQAIADTITVMDPYFFPAIHYYATYLASVWDAPQKGAEVYAKAGWFRPDDFRLVFNEMILRLTYEEPLNEERVVTLAKQAMEMDEKIRYVGAVDYVEMVEGMMHFAASRRQRNEKKREDLLWLFEHSKNLKRKEEIRRQIALIK